MKWHKFKEAMVNSIQAIQVVLSFGDPSQVQQAAKIQAIQEQQKEEAATKRAQHQAKEDPDRSSRDRGEEGVPERKSARDMIDEAKAEADHRPGEQQSASEATRDDRVRTETSVSAPPTQREKELGEQLKIEKAQLERLEEQERNDQLGHVQEQFHERSKDPSTRSAADQPGRASDPRPPGREGPTPGAPATPGPESRSGEPERSGGRESGTGGRSPLRQAGGGAAPAQGASNSARNDASAGQREGSDQKPRLDQGGPAKGTQPAASAGQKQGSDGKVRLGRETSSSGSAAKSESSRQETSKKESSSGRSSSTSRDRSR